jgi:hypothetical protein
MMKPSAELSFTVSVWTWWKWLNPSWQLNLASTQTEKTYHMFKTDAPIQTKYAGYFCILGHTVAQLVEALCYKVEANRFISQWGHWDFSLTYSFRTTGLESTQPLTEMIPGIYPGHKGSRSLRLTILPTSCADCLEILGTSTSCSTIGLSKPV